MFFKNWKTALLVTLLSGVAVIGPMVAYAGVTVLYSESTHTVQVGGTPPISFTQGSDYASASGLGVAAGFAVQDSGASFVITLNAISGGNVTIDKYVQYNKTAGVTSYKFQVAQAITGTLDTTEITRLKIRVWTGGTPPTSDGSAGVCTVLDLEAALNTESAACTQATAYIQVTFELAANASGSSTVAIRPSSIV